MMVNASREKETSALAASDQTATVVPTLRVGGEIIRTSQLTKVYPGTDFAAVDRLESHRAPRRDLRSARTERRREDDHRRHVDDPGCPDLW